MLSPNQIEYLIVRPIEVTFPGMVLGQVRATQDRLLAKCHCHSKKDEIPRYWDYFNPPLPPWIPFLTLNRHVMRPDQANIAVLLYTGKCRFCGVNYLAYNILDLSYPTTIDFRPQDPYLITEHRHNGRTNP